LIQRFASPCSQEKIRSSIKPDHDALLPPDRHGPGARAIHKQAGIAAHSSDPLHAISTPMNAAGLPDLVNFTLFERLPCVHHTQQAF
jgi:hypothetical protein